MNLIQKYPVPENYQLPKVVNLESQASKVFAPMVLPLDQQNGVGICLHASVNHSGMLSKVIKGKKPLSYSICFSYGAARTMLPTSKVPNLDKDGSSLPATLTQIEMFGLLPKGRYGVFDLSYNNTSYCQNWGKYGLPAAVFAAKRDKFAVYQITNAKEWIWACIKGFGIFFVGKFVWNQSSPSGIISPDILPSVYPKDSPYAHLLGSHAESGIGYKIIGEKVFGAIRNHNSIKSHRGGQDHDFPYKGTGLIDLNGPEMQVAYRYGCYALEAL